MLTKLKYKISEHNQNKKIFFLFLILFLFFPKNVFAENILSLSAIPPRLEISVNPGQVITKEIKIRNESSFQRSIETDVKDFIVTDDSGTPVQINADPSQNRWAASSWLQISPTKTNLKPGETKSLIVTVLAPKDAAPGGHYAVILHNPQNENYLNSSGASIQANIGTLVYITIPGNVKENAIVKDFSAPKFSEFGPVNFKTTINNLSDIHITPAGSINVTNFFGGKTAKLALSTTNIFPYTNRDFTNTLNKKFLFGRYKAQFLAAYGSTGQTISATIFFWVIPWKLLILIFFALAIITILILILKNKRKLNRENIHHLEQELEDLKKKYKDK
jgi:hypothetical protein